MFNLQKKKRTCLVSRATIFICLVFSLASANFADAASNATISWQRNSTNEDGFKIERCVGVNCSNFAQIGTTLTGITTAIDPNLTPGLSYCYRVRAYNTAGDSAYSNTACIAVPQIIPGAPSNVTVVITSTP